MTDAITMTARRRAAGDTPRIPFIGSGRIGIAPGVRAIGGRDARNLG
jgi:hypothetical protein